MTENETKQAKNRAVLVGLNAHCLSAEENADDTSMEELADLLETAGGVCVGTVFQNKDAPDPRTFIGEGKAAEVKELVGAMGADMVVVDNPLSPSQQRVLSEELGVQVLDRAALILDIFAQRGDRLFPGPGLLGPGADPRGGEGDYPPRLRRPGLPGPVGGLLRRQPQVQAGHAEVRHDLPPLPY